MRSALLFSLLVAAILSPSIAQAEPAAITAWFTQASLENSQQIAKPADALPDAPGSVGSGVLLTKAVPVDNPLLEQKNGLISFWIQAKWDGNDGKAHRILRIGDPERNGLLLEKAATGMLRYVMASPKKITAARADVSYWKAGEWHQVAIAWMDREGKPLGLPLWIDKVAAAGPIAGGNEFLNPEKMDDKRVWIGDSTSEAVMDELVMRNRFDTERPPGQLAQVYRDYFRGAPYTKIEIDPEPCLVPADRRVINGFQKQFGLKAGSGEKMERITDFAVRYGQWADFDAKPLIRWQTSDQRIASVDENGMATGKSLGKCKLTAEFRGMRASYDVQVIQVEQPDLDLIYVERLPRYPFGRVKNDPAPGERVKSVAHIINFGYVPVPAGTVVRFELIPDANRNFRLDANERATQVQEKELDKPLAPRDEQKVTFYWKWTDEPNWVRVTLDPDNEVGELCEANNQCCELNTARPLHFAYNPKTMEDCYKEKKINHVGSFSYYDWINAQKLRFDVMIRESVWPTTSPDGIRDAYRTDNYYALGLGNWEDEPYVVNDKYYDGGFPVNEPVNLMAIDAAILHEFGHTCAALPDLYGYPVDPSNVFLKDEKGEYYAGGELLPKILWGVLPFSSANNVPCGVGYPSLMDSCHLWVHPAQAGQVQYFAGYRGDRFWGEPGRLIPSREHYLQVFDVNDKPLVGAAIYVYQVTQTDARNAGTKYFADRPKFIGNTDEDGRFLMAPGTTDEGWDDPDTDVVEGAWPVWNPFGRAKTTTGAPPDVAFTPNVWCVEGLDLIKIVSRVQVEFAWLSLTDLNEAFFSGHKVRGVYPVRTSLLPSPEETPIVRQEMPDAIKKTNLKPVAVADAEMTVKCGQEFTIDGSKSYDPEGQPLVYRWLVNGRAVAPDSSAEPVYKGTAGKEPVEVEITFYVIDGLRVSEPLWIKVHVVAPATK